MPRFSLSNSWLSFFYFAMNAFFFYLSPLCLRATSINISMCIVCVHFFSIQCTQPHAFAAGGHDFALNHWARSLYCTEVCNKFANSAPQNVKQMMGFCVLLFESSLAILFFVVTPKLVYEFLNSIKNWTFFQKVNQHFHTNYELFKTLKIYFPAIISILIAINFFLFKPPARHGSS